VSHAHRDTRGIDPVQAALLRDLVQEVRIEGAAVASGPDLRWAHRIISRAEDGERISHATLKIARAALAEAAGRRGAAGKSA
jgi:hypothetical protein